ncbi:DUF3373 family protein [Sulfurimonas aquatica]|uniref:DUF3373 family protein n=1 Tax=Sulfurimonas aquatica TaxID=2672570 RepID=A0A975AYM7_9BACT|nr:DUF3373 family protein [Sulfurimonas aquatica]QSZ41011.1 DUF3373 family protein [Sulfurimonas aquatica]
MNKPLLISLAAATILATSLNAQSMYERIQSMELNIKKMQDEISTLRASGDEKSDDESANDESEEESDEEDSEDETKSTVEEADSDDGEEEDDEEEEFNAQEEIEEINESIFELNKATNGNKLKLGADYRFAIDNMQYKMADGSDAGNDAFMTNRLWINMDWKATDNLSFSGQLAYNKAFGHRSGWNSNIPGMETFDWVTNENAYDDLLRVRSAYFLYKNDTFMGTEIPWTFSIGRRPSTNGHLINLRDDDGAASPMGHTINVEFDGISSKFSFEDLTGIEGMYVKFCAGRGGTNANPKFFAVNPQNGSVVQTGAPYATQPDDLGDIDLGGLIFVPYDNGQYAFATQYYYANNLIDADIVYPGGVPTMNGMKTVGGMHSFTANFTVNGIGDEWNDYLDDTFFFISGAMSVTDPKSDERMLYGKNDLTGATTVAGESVTGHSVWLGLQMPSFITEDGRWGVEYNQGSQYWRSITYAEDTNIGSKLATRGSAYEVYFTEPLVEDILTFQIRYTYIDYEYTGSNGFFGGDTGSAVLIKDLTPMTGSTVTVDTAQDIRAYLRYRF